MAKIPPTPFILVDGSSYLFRAYYALPPLITSQGQPTGAIFGVINMLRKLLLQYKPEAMAVVFDSKEKNFRHTLYPNYKANRIIMPEELQRQIEPLHLIIKAMGLPLIMIEGTEADDVIGTIALKAEKSGQFVLISTGDKDFAQLVNENIFLINTMSNDIFDREKIIEKFEVGPEQIIDYLTLIGDTVDNVPGVPKVGPKTAVKWLKSYANLEEIIKHADKIPGIVGGNLRESLDLLPLFRQLITIQVDLPVEYEPAEFLLKKPQVSILKNLYSELEFKTLLKDLENLNEPDLSSVAAGDHISPDKNVYETILTKAAFEKWLEILKRSKLFAFDTETTSLDYMLAEIVGVSFCVVPGQAAYVPLAHDYEGVPPQLSREWVLEHLKPLLENEDYFKVGHNLKYDMEVLANHGIVLRGIAFDTMLESYVLNSIASRHDMDTLASRHLNYQSMSYEIVAGKGAKQVTFNKVSLEKATFYAAEDADVTLKLHNALWPSLETLDKQKAIFEKIEMPLIAVLANMERKGVLVDDMLLASQSKELGERLNALQEEAYAWVGKPFNMNSPKQLQEILYTQLKLPVLEKTPTGQPSTAEFVMQELAETYPLPKIILEYRSLSKLKFTYTDKLPKQINPNTGRVHTSYHQAVTATGRLSSSDPNLQNIPIRSVEGRKIRKAFIASVGYKIVAADYSQIELRIMAHMSQDPALLNAFKMGDDIHRSTAATIFGVDLNSVTSQQRRNAKTINFGLMYGMSSYGLAKQLGIERSEAEKQIADYFACFPGVKTFMEEIQRCALAQGFVETLLGRRLYLPNIQAANVTNRRAAERAAINAPMQGTNADLIKLSMIALEDWIRNSDLDVSIIMQVHDELIFEIPEHLVVEASAKIKQIMETIFPLSVPLRVEIGIGDNWDEAH